MIGSAERRRRARELGVQEPAIERDFILACLLAAYAEEPGRFILRGGTALARTYWPDHRLSEDLDLITDAQTADLEEWMTGRVARARELAGTRLQLRFGRANQGWSRSYVDRADDSIVLDVNADERVGMPTESRRLNLPYEDLRGLDLAVETVALAEILGNKWFMIEDRNEPRDLFDVWWGVSRAGVRFAVIAAGHRAKFGYPPVRQVLSRAEVRLKGAWEERLAHQLREPPEFDLVLREVREAYDRWEEAGKS